MEAARQLGERNVDRSADVARPPFPGLADVDDDDASCGEQVGRAACVDRTRSGEEAHGSGPRRALDDRCELAPRLGGDRRKFRVADDREHSLGVDRGDVRLAAAPVDDDIARQQGAESGSASSARCASGGLQAPRIR